MKKVILVQHSYEIPGTEHEEIKFIGVYSNRALAESAVQRLVVQPGFRDYPNGFHIEECTIDRDNWTEGFISWDEAMKDDG